MGLLHTGRPARWRVTPAPSTRATLALPAAGTVVALLLSTAVPAAADPLPDDLDLELDEPSVIEISLDDRDELDRLVATGADLAAVEPDGDALVAYTVVTPEEYATLAEDGFALGDVVYSESDAEERVDEREEIIAELEEENEELAEEATTLADTDAVTILRVDYFESSEGEFLSVEAKSSDGQSANFPLTVAWDSGPGTEIGSGGSANLSRFVDVGVYLYHRGVTPVDTRPDRVEVTSPNGGSAVADVTEWLPDTDVTVPPMTDFVTAYMTPDDLNERIHQLADEFPNLAEIVELPNQTNGYRRKAQALLGNNATQAVVVDSVAWGHEGGNDLTLELANPGEPNQDLKVSVAGNDIRVDLATNANGNPASTAAQVVAALNAEAGDLVEAYTFRGNAGNGIAQPASATQLSDNLSAPDSVSRDPQDVYMLRIGRDRDGSKPGVFAYALEHAREWQTPLVTIETAERLLRNYALHAPTRRLVDNLDIFIVPTVNPDGTNYSFYDYALQRKNMTNYCPQSGFGDPLARDSWGVDNNRNYGAYTMWDGYAGASSDCTSQVYAGPDDPGPLSQPESQNVVWVADEFPNIQFSMNIHSWGDYFMWAPGAYVQDGRVPAPRPELSEEAYFWAASESILTAIKAHRGTVVTPGRTGPIIDVLYSAAGNSGDHLWYLNDIYAWNFEVGNAGFQPPWPEAHQQALEYSNGLYNMLEVAYQLDNDNRPPRSDLVPGAGSYDGPVEVTFETNEPAAVYYTLDGSRPTYESTRLGSAGLREGPETILIEETTTIQWFSVDAAGNVENRYDPDGNNRTFRRATVVIE